MPVNMPPMEGKIELPEYTGGRLSPTQIDMYLRCPLQYYHRYVEKVIAPPGVAMIEGSAHHKALEMNNMFKKEQHKDLKPEQVIERFEDEFDTRKTEIVNWEGETTESVIGRGRGLTRRYMADFAPIFQPEHIEKIFEVCVGAVPVIGFMDAAGTLNSRPVQTAVDYKVASRAKSAKEVEQSIQLSFYGWGLLAEQKVDTVEAGFCVLKKTKTPAVEWQSTLITPARCKRLRNIVTSVAYAIQRGVFPPCDPTAWCCDPKWCGYYDQCMRRLLC